jgi:hypothetical protein
MDLDLDLLFTSFTGLSHPREKVQSSIGLTSSRAPSIVISAYVKRLEFLIRRYKRASISG